VDQLTLGFALDMRGLTYPREAGLGLQSTWAIICLEILEGSWLKYCNHKNMRFFLNGTEIYIYLTKSARALRRVFISLRLALILESSPFVGVPNHAHDELLITLKHL
jgi:hypothetical protein